MELLRCCLLLRWDWLEVPVSVFLRWRHHSMSWPGTTSLPGTANNYHDTAHCGAVTRRAHTSRTVALSSTSLDQLPAQNTTEEAELHPQRKMITRPLGAGKVGQV